MATIFIGSSREALPSLRLVRACIEEAGHNALPWNYSRAFMPGDHLLASLLRIAENVDGAVLILTPDDKTWYRGKMVTKPRDNLLLEYGLFAGYLSPKRAIICVSGGPALASDLDGLVYVDFSEGRQGRGELSLIEWMASLTSSARGTLRLTSTSTDAFKLLLDRIDNPGRDAPVVRADISAITLSTYHDFVPELVQRGIDVRTTVLHEDDLARFDQQAEALKRSLKELRSRVHGDPLFRTPRRYRGAPSLRSVVLYDRSSQPLMVAASWFSHPRYLPAASYGRPFVVASVDAPGGADLAKFAAAQFERRWNNTLLRNRGRATPVQARPSSESRA